MKTLICVRQQPSAPLGAIAGWLEESRTPWRYVDAWRDRWPPLDEVAGAIVLGGEMNVDEHERYPWLRDELAFMKGACERDVPILGICLGAQMLARALGARVGPSPVREVGFTGIRATVAGRGDPVLGPFADTGRLFQWHEDAFELPAGAELLFTNADVPNQGFRFGECAYGVQFHFEVTGEIISEWCAETDPDELAGVWGVTEDELLRDASRFLPLQQAAGRRVVEGFAARLREEAAAT